MDVIPALNLWDLVLEVFHSSLNQTNKTKDVREPWRNLSANTQPNMQKQIPTTNTNLDLTNIDHVPSSGTHSGSNAMVFEDNEAVIKMIIKGRSPTMRHVSRTHRVALDWLFDRINLDSTIQIRYTDSSLISCLKTMAKKDAGAKRRRKCGKIEIYIDDLSSHVPTSSSSAKSLIASKSPEILIATWKLESRMRRNSKSDAASSSRARLQDAYFGGLMDTANGKPVATRGIMGCGHFRI